MKAGHLAWPMFAAGVVMNAIGIALMAGVPAQVLAGEDDSVLLRLSFVLILLAFGGVGVVVAARFPRNPIGWLFLGLHLDQGAYEMANGYATYSLTVSEFPATSYAAWFANVSSPIAPALIGLAFLHFPDGRLPSRRWRPAAWFCVAAIIPVVAGYALVPGPLEEFPSVRNPLGVEAAAFLGGDTAGPLVIAIFVVTVLAVVVRFRRSRGVERQQLKWFAWAAGLLTGYLLTVGVLTRGLGVDEPDGVVSGYLFAIVLCGLPVSAGVAILRYRLYDIDLVINRTLVYGLLTAMLLGTYLGSVLLLRLVLSPWTGESDLAVAASTLAVAALFRPLRARIQSVVDRRFYRQRYDAGRTVEGFAGRLREEIDLQTLGLDLREVVGRSLQPAHVSLWLRSPS